MVIQLDKMLKADADNLVVTPSTNQSAFMVFLIDGANGDGPGVYLKQNDGSYVFVGDSIASAGGTINGSILVDGDIKQQAGHKVGLFGVDGVVQPNVSAQAFVAPTDLPTAITQIEYLQTVVAAMRTALEQIGAFSVS